MYDVVGVVASLASTMASVLGWSERDARRYTRLVYVDRDIRLLLETESSRVGEIVAQGVVDIMKERMSQLRDREYRAIALSRDQDRFRLTARDRDFVIDVESEIDRRESEFQRLAGGA